MNENEKKRRRRIREIALVRGTRDVRSPGLGVAAGAHQRQRAHDHREQPAGGHYVDGGAQLEPAVQVYGVRDCVPTLAGDYHQREHGKHAREHGQETGHLAANTCRIDGKHRGT